MLKDSMTILLSFILAFMLIMLPLPDELQWYRPEWVALLLIFWLLRKPEMISLGSAFLLGLCVDLLQGYLTGEHALAMTGLAFLTLRYRRQYFYFTYWQQTLLVLCFLLLYKSVLYVAESLLVAKVTTLWFWMPALISAFFWPLFGFYLQVQQRKVSRW